MLQLKMFHLLSLSRVVVTIARIRVMVIRLQPLQSKSTVSDRIV